MNKFRVSVGFFHWTNPALRPKKNSRKNKLNIGQYLFKFFSGSPYTHCDVRIYCDNLDFTLLCTENRQATFYPTDSVHGFFGKSDKNIELGEFEFDVSKIDNFLFPSYVGNRWRLILWYFMTRFLFFNRTKTCTTAVCHILQDIGLPVGIFVLPVNLYEEIRNAPNFNGRKGWRWKDYFG